MKTLPRLVAASVVALLGLASKGLAQTPAASARKPAPALSHATFAGGCFWCMEAAFERLPGVVSAVSGYTGGTTKNPTYEEVSSGGTGHAESVDVTFDPAKVCYEKLLSIFWQNIDPLTPTASSATTASSTARRSSSTTTRSGRRPRPRRRRSRRS